MAGSAGSGRPTRGNRQVGDPDLDVGRDLVILTRSIRNRVRVYDYCGPLAKAIPTNVAGIEIGELLPLLAKQADKYSILRGMTHGNFAHETAAYWVQTGRAAGGREVYPCAGAVTSLFKGYDAGYTGLIPPI
jgi:hypothetical protein